MQISHVFIPKNFTIQGGLLGWVAATIQPVAHTNKPSVSVESGVTMAPMPNKWPRVTNLASKICQLFFPFLLTLL